MNARRICVFCGSHSGASTEYGAAAAELGRLLAARKLGLVYGGGNVGLMGVLADAALAAGGEVLGVIPQFLVAKEIAHTGLSEMRVVNSMHERKALMAELSDAFIALPGGFGTLDEFCEVLTWSQLGLIHKPCGILNTAGYYDHLLRMFDHAEAVRFVKPSHRRLLAIGSSPVELLDALLTAEVPVEDKWINRKSL